MGGYNCSKCPNGFTGGGRISEGGCKDIDEVFQQASKSDSFSAHRLNIVTPMRNAQTPTVLTHVEIAKLVIQVTEKLDAKVSDFINKFDCLATCSPACKNGSCTAPNVCTCNSGWTGAACDSKREFVKCLIIFRRGRFWIY
jgi:hypothetical protein